MYNLSEKELLYKQKNFMSLPLPVNSYLIGAPPLPTPLRPSPGATDSGSVRCEGASSQIFCKSLKRNIANHLNEKLQIT